MNRKVIRFVVKEIMVFGVVYFVGFVVDYWVDMREIVELWKVERIFELKMDEKIRERFYKGWKDRKSVV